MAGARCPSPGLMLKQKTVKDVRDPPPTDPVSSKSWVQLWGIRGAILLLYFVPCLHEPVQNSSGGCAEKNRWPFD